MGGPYRRKIGKREDGKEKGWNRDCAHAHMCKQEKIAQTSSSKCICLPVRTVGPLLFYTGTRMAENIIFLSTPPPFGKELVC